MTGPSDILELEVNAYGGEGWLPKRQPTEELQTATLLGKQIFADVITFRV